MYFKKIGKFKILPLLFTLTLLLISAITLNAQGASEYTISGRVTASDNGNPLTSTVLFYNNMVPDGNINQGGTDYIPLDKVATDDNGYFTIKLKAGYKYKLQVYPWNEDYNNAFYNNADNLENAAIIDLNQDYSEINFTLSKKPVFDNGFHGVVNNIDGIGVSAKITAILLNNNSNSYSTSTEQNTGSFSFTNIAPGQYLIYAMPQVYGYSDGYFRENDIAVKDISLAAIITINKSGINDENYLVILPNKEESDKSQGVTGIVLDEYKQPVENVNITILAELGMEVKTKDPIFTDSKGIFNLNITGTGKYQVIASKDGYDQGIFSFFYDETVQNQSIQLLITKKEVVSFDNGIKGIVRNSNGEPIWSEVTAFKVEPDEKNNVNANYISVKTTYTSKENPGEFNFSNLKPGNYILFAAPYTTASGFYKENESVVLQMEDATVITVNETGINDEKYVINMIDEPIGKIMFTITGVVSDNSNNLLQDVKIGITDEHGKTVFEKDLYTDNSGIINFELPSGIFTLEASKDGFINNTIPINTSIINATSIKLSIVMEKMTTEDSKLVSDISDNNAQSNIFETYPNPASDYLTLKLAELSGELEISVLDINGTTVIFNSTNVKGNSLDVIDISSLPIGAYTVRVRNTNNQLKICKFIKK